MARHPQPRELAVLKGAPKHDPQRYRKQPPKSEFPLGDAPAHLTKDAKAIWFELASYAMKGVLTGADRAVLEITANLMAEYRRAPEEFAIGKYTHMIGCLARLGLSPADRQKLGTDKPPEDNPFNEI